MKEHSEPSKEKQKNLLIEIIQEDEKNGMYEERQDEIWNDVFQNYMIWQDQEPKLSDLLKDFKISRR